MAMSQSPAQTGALMNTPEMSGIAQHPAYPGKKVDKGMRLPGDTRAFRDIKIKEIPSWIMKRDFSPLGIYFYLKRKKYFYRNTFMYVRNPGLNCIGMFLVSYGLLSHFVARDITTLEGQKRKYH